MNYWPLEVEMFITSHNTKISVRELRRSQRFIWCINHVHEGI